MSIEKKVTHYFVYVGHGTQTKNKLQEEFGNFLKEKSGVLIDYYDLDHLKLHIINKSKDFNAMHNRCTPLEIGFEDLYTKNGFMITGFHFLTFQILAAYNESI